MLLAATHESLSGPCGKYCCASEFLLSACKRRNSKSALAFLDRRCCRGCELNRWIGRPQPQPSDHRPRYWAPLNKAKRIRYLFGLGTYLPNHQPMTGNYRRWCLRDPLRSRLQSQGASDVDHDIRYNVCRSNLSRRDCVYDAAFYASRTSTISLISQSRLVTFAAMAGVVRSAHVLLWTLSAVGENPECHVPSPSCPRWPQIASQQKTSADRSNG